MSEEMALTKLVETVRKVKHLSREADEWLYGIYGFPLGQARERRIERAKALMKEASEIMSNFNLIQEQLNYGTHGSSKGRHPSAG